MTLNLLDFVLLMNNLVVAFSGMSTYNQFIYSNCLSIFLLLSRFSMMSCFGSLGVGATHLAKFSDYT